MTSLRTRQFQLSRVAGKLVVRLAAMATLYRMPPFVSASAVVCDGRRILVVVDPIRNEPILPGGHLKWTESPSDALVREVWEETGYLVRPVDLVTVQAGEEWAGEPGVVRIVYTAEIVGGALQSSPEGEALWHDADTLAASATRDAPLVRLWRERGNAQVDST